MKKKSLRSLVKKEKTKFKDNIIKKLLRDIKYFYFPSKSSVLFIFLFFILSLIISFIPANENSSIFVNVTYIQNMIAVMAGFGSIIFALFILIAESLRDDQSLDKARVLLRESLIFPITSMEILLLIILLIGWVNYLTIIPLIFTGILTFISLYRIVSVMLNKPLFNRKRKQLLKDRLNQSIELAIDQRIGEIIYFNKFKEKNFKLEYNPFYNDELLSSYFCVYADKSGVVYDIDFSSLEKLSKLIDDNSKNLGFSFSNVENPEVENNTSEFQLENKIKINKKRFVTKKISDLITDDNRLLVCIDRVLIPENCKFLEKLESLAKSAFVIKKETYFSEEIRTDLEGLHKQMRHAIEENQLKTVQELCDVYLELTGSFLEVWTKYGGGYTFEQARRELSSIWGKWEEAHWIASDIYDNYQLAFKKQDKDIMLSFTRLSYSITAKSISSDDQYLFQIFIDYQIHLYKLTLHLAEEKELFLDRVWRYIREISDFYIESQLRNENNSIVRKESLKDFAIYIFIVLQELMKLSFENKDIPSFKKFVNTANYIFNFFQPSQSRTSAALLKLDINNPHLSQEEKEILNNRILTQEQLEGIEKEIGDRRKQMFFGVASYILSKYHKKKSDSTVREFYDCIQDQLPKNIIDLTKEYTQARQESVIEFWRWDDWEFVEESEGEFQRLDFNTKIHYLYVIKSLSILSSIKDENILNISLPIDNSSDYSLCYEIVIGILEEIKKNFGEWNFILPKESQTKIGSLISILNNSNQEQEKIRILEKRKAPISINAVRKIRNDFRKSFNEKVILRKIFKKWDLFIDNSNMKLNSDQKRIGVNRIEDKSVFIEEFHESYSGWGDYYGRQMAVYEEYFVLSEIKKCCRSIDDFNQKIIMESFDDIEDLVMIFSDPKIYLFLLEKTNFIQRYLRPEKQDDNILGWFVLDKNEIPIFYCRQESDISQLFILNKKKIGKLFLLPPLNITDKEEEKFDSFYFSIKSFSEDEKIMQEFIENPPPWLEKYKTNEEKIDYLSEKVLLKIFERIEFKVDKEFMGLMIDKSKLIDIKQ